MSSAWVFNWEYSAHALLMLVLSCVCAVGVNISQFACLGRFSAVSFQVRCHACCDRVRSMVMDSCQKSNVRRKSVRTFSASAYQPAWTFLQRLCYLQISR